MSNQEDISEPSSSNAKNEENNSRFSRSFFYVPSKLFGAIIARSSFSSDEKIQLLLDKAEMGVNAVEYYSGVFFWSLLAGVLVFAVALVFHLTIYRSSLIFLLIPVAIVIVLGTGLAFPYLRVSSRRKRIDENLGSAFAFISAMANADVPIDAIILKLSEMPEYGEVRREAAKIAVLTEMQGTDIFTAMKEVARVSPSTEWQKFLQGAVAASTAGARLKPYFVNKAADFQNTLRISLKRNTESVTIFAETYVTVGVAFPLFLIVILSVMAVIARNASGTTIGFLVLFSFLILPVITAMFVLLISSVNKEVQIS